MSPGDKCDLPYFRVDQVDSAVWEWVKSFLTNPVALVRGLKTQQAEREKSCHPSRERLAIVEELLADSRRKFERLLDLYLTRDFPKEVLVEHKTGLEATIRVLETERNDLSAQLEAQTITDEQVTTITEFAQEVACGLEEADRDLEARRQMIELLDVKVTLALEDGEKVAYVRCAVGNDALSIVPTFSSNERI